MSDIFLFAAVMSAVSGLQGQIKGFGTSMYFLLFLCLEH